MVGGGLIYHPRHCGSVEAQANAHGLVINYEANQAGASQSQCTKEARVILSLSRNSENDPHSQTSSRQQIIQYPRPLFAAEITNFEVRSTSTKAGLAAYRSHDLAMTYSSTVRSADVQTPSGVTSLTNHPLRRNP
jgi:hypothetical protein